MNEASDSRGRLSIVATPIGNMGDITFRALWNLKECDVIYAEDTRIVSKILTHYGLTKSIFRLDAATEGKKAKEVLARVLAGEHVVYVSDAGTPGISDPGARLVSFIRGVDSAQFTFLGFPPHKKGRQTFIKQVSKSDIPVVLFESPHRIQKLLSELDAVKVKKVSIGRELTKLHEEMLSGTPKELAVDLRKRKAERGEFVVIVEA
jgi:16S rRNA (cytidine1402-2'-O)-methyltransferase